MRLEPFFVVVELSGYLGLVTPPSSHFFNKLYKIATGIFHNQFPSSFYLTMLIFVVLYEYNRKGGGYPKCLKLH